MTRLSLSLCALLLCLGCPPTDDDPTGDDDDSTEDLGPPPAGLAQVSGSCPDLSSSGPFSITSSDAQRSGQLFLPSGGAEGAPVLFAWHGLGDSSARFSSALSLGDFADEHGMIVVVPDVNPASWTGLWEHLGGEADLTLYDELRTCLAEQHDVDLRRVHSTGFSGGALWTSRLAMERADTLASIFAMSGGAGVDGAAQYSTPSHDFPALLMWGGVRDSYDAGILTLHFDQASLAFSESLRADGHFVVHCDHGNGHTITFDTRDMLGRWVTAHQFGQTSPFEGTDGSDVASWCVVP